MPTIQAASAPIYGSRIANVEWRTGPTQYDQLNRASFMSDDRTVVYGSRFTSIIQTVDAGLTWTVLATIGETIQQLWRLPNGEVAVGTNVGGGRGGLWFSTGWAENPATATWTKRVTVSAANNSIPRAWGVGFAPKGHAREGLIVANEYGSHGQSATPDDGGAARAWLSLDYGETWREIFNMFTFLGNKVGQHLHGCAYDPWDDRLLMSFGDGNTGSGAETGVVACGDFLEATPTWTYVDGPVKNARYQSVNIMPRPEGIWYGCDGYPAGIYFQPRTGFRELGPMRVPVQFPAGTDTGFIGGLFFQHGPGFPMFFSSQWIKTDSPRSPAIHSTMDFKTFGEPYRHPVTLTASRMDAVGPTASGKMVLMLSGDGYKYGSGDWAP